MINDCNQLYTRIIYKTILFTVAAIALLPSPSAAQKITIDPNTSGSRPAQQAITNIDSRLSQKVTYEAKRKTVSSILADLTKMTDVKFKAGWNEKDWQVRDRKMNIYVKDVPLANLMNSIAGVMKFKWSRAEQNGLPTYKLYMDRKAILDAEAKRMNREKNTAQHFNDIVDSFDKYSKLAAVDKEKLRKENPLMYIMDQANSLQPMADLMKNAPAIGESIRTGKGISLNAADLCLVAQQALRNSLKGLNKIDSMFCLSDQESTIPQELLDNIEQATISIGDRDRNGLYLGSINLRYGDYHTYFSFPDPINPVMKISSKELLDCIEAGMSMSDIKAAKVAQIEAKCVKILSESDDLEPAIEHKDNPALHKQVTLKKSERDLSKLLFQLAESAPVNIVSDSFGLTKPFTGVGISGTELLDILEYISDNYIYNWDMRADIFEFQSREWFSKRALQIPEEWLEKWRSTLKKNGTIDIADLAQIAMLTSEQYKANVSTDEVLGQYYYLGYLGTDLPLHFYASLTEAQRATLDVSGLDLAALSPDQQTQARNLITNSNADYLKNADARVMFNLNRKKRGKQFIYTLSANTTDDLQPIKWTIETPEYEPPKEAKKE